MTTCTTSVLVISSGSTRMLKIRFSSTDRLKVWPESSILRITMAISNSNLANFNQYGAIIMFLTPITNPTQLCIAVELNSSAEPRMSMHGSYHVSHSTQTRMQENLIESRRKLKMYLKETIQLSTLTN
jgi:hypothetical protein